MSLINCETNLIVTWFINSVISTAANQETTFPITDTKFLFWLSLNHFKLIQNDSNNWNHILKEQLTEIDINQK